MCNRFLGKTFSKISLVNSIKFKSLSASRELDQEERVSWNSSSLWHDKLSFPMRLPHVSCYWRELVDS